ncbi:MAG TPA: GNAT family N-acetyltransferase [Solirubrobacterales bacterium]|jgi:GNAT superfamily N-acetyltransferase|nr:GNAT family N-acetyltransferase [Solirubrobacterales bacterium]
MQGAPKIEVETVGRDDTEVRALYAVFMREADGPLVAVGRMSETELAAGIAAGPPAALVPPGGALLLARVDGEAAGIAGVRHLETEVAEVKSMYVEPSHRGVGLGRRLLTEVERIAAEHGCRRVRLDTSDYLSEAIGLYRSAGYAEVADYNANPKASLWFEREL